MSRAATFAFACLAFLLLASAAQAQTKICSDWDAAFEEAERRNVPVLFLLGRDGKAPWAQWMKVPAVAKYINDRVLVLVAHRGGDHEPETKLDPRTKEQVSVCPIYGTAIACELHREYFNTYAGHYDYTDLPAGFILNPQRKAIISNAASLPAKKLMEKIDEVQFGLGEGVFNSEILKLEKKLSKGDEKLAKKKFKAAISVYAKASKKKLKAHLQKIVDARYEALDKQALEAIEAAKALEPAKRHEELKRIARECKGRGPAEEATKALAEAEGGE